MRYKNQRPSNFTTGQVQQLEHSRHNLRELNRIARDELRRIGHIDPTPRQCSEASDSLRIVTTQMNLAVRCCQEILKAGGEQQPSLIIVSFGMLCNQCSESEKLRKHDDAEIARKALKPDPAHQTEVASLLKLTNRIEEIVWTRSRFRRAPPAFITAIGRFRLTVLRQQHQLQAAAGQDTAIQVELDDSNNCGNCHKSMEIDDTTEGHERQV